MNSKHQNKQWNAFLFILSIFLFITIIDACRKIEQETSNPNDPENIVVNVDKFFNVPANADKRLKAIAKDMQEANTKRNFVDKVVKRIGYPRWDKAIVQTKKGKTNRGQEEEQDTAMINLPFTLGPVTSAVLNIGIHILSARDTAYQLLYPQHYKDYGFDTTSRGWNSLQVFQLFSGFDYAIFGTDSFDVYDGRIFGKPQNDTQGVKLNHNGWSRTGRTNYWDIECVAVRICQISNVKKPFRGNTEVCSDRTICTPFWVQTGEGLPGGLGSGSGAGPLNPPGGSGGNSGHGAGDWNEEPVCPSTERNNIANPCAPPWFPGNGDPFADYMNWGYHHFETWDVSPEDATTASDWAANNIDTAGLNPCVRGILDDLLGSGSFIGKILTKLDRAAGRTPDVDKFYLKFRTAALPYGVGAKTTTGVLNPVDGVYSDTIKINNDGGLDSMTQLAMARNIIHEIIHSYMNSILKRYYNVAHPELISEDSVWDTYADTLVVLHTRENIRNWALTHAGGDFDHNFMAEKLLSRMADALAFVDNNRNSDEFYWSLCWGGLYKTRPMNQVWPNAPSWPPVGGNPAPSDDSTRGLKYALTSARLDSLTSWVSRERYDTAKAKGRRHQSTGCYGN